MTPVRLLVAALVVPLAHAVKATASKSSLQVDAPSSVALAITGTFRTLLASPVTQSYQRRLNPNLTAGVHIVIAGDVTSGREALLRTTYNPRTYRTMVKLGLDDELNLTCTQGNVTSTKPHHEKAALLQWYGIREVYHDIEQYESTADATYDWIIRLRTDLVFFETLDRHFLGALSYQHVHFPAGGMSSEYEDRWTNDHYFLCPRHLCRAYFELAELWTSPFCDPEGKAPVGIFGTTPDNGTTIVMGAKPTKAYSVIPTPIEPPMKWEWYLMTRYTLDGGVYLTAEERHDDNFNYVGLAHEVSIAYTFANGNETDGYLSCDPMEGPISNRTWRDNSVYASTTLVIAQQECATDYSQYWGHAQCSGTKCDEGPSGGG
jgi:hypothetical protein